MEAHFSRLYEKLALSLETILSVPTVIEKTWSRPGFHIFLQSQEMHAKKADVHFDLQFYKLLTSPYLDFESDVISFTVTLSLPKSGGAD